MQLFARGKTNINRNLKELKNITGYYCQNEFGGVLQRGLLSTMLALTTFLKNEMKVNNFTKYIGEPTLESEVALIAV
jgi:hypothetical protein